MAGSNTSKDNWFQEIMRLISELNVYDNARDYINNNKKKKKRWFRK